MFPTRYPPLRFTCSAAIGHWSSGCHNTEAHCVKHAVWKARKVVEAKIREEAEKRRLVKEKKRKKRLEYLQQLQDEVLAENATLLGALKIPRSQELSVRRLLQKTRRDNGFLRRLKRSNQESTMGKLELR